MIKEWLNLFWEPGQFVLQESNVKRKILNQSTYYDLPTVMTANEEHPYGVFFTPNWNLGKKNHVWEKIKRSKVDVDDTISAFYIDIDLRDSSFKSLESLYSHILEVIQKDKLPVQYIVKSWWGFHLYLFITPEERNQVYKTYHDKFKLIQVELSKLFDWWDPNSHSLNKLMRMPGSQHWKSWFPLDVELYHRKDTGYEKVLNKDEIVLDTKLCISDDNIASFLNNIKKVTIVPDKWTLDVWVKKINDLKIKDVIYALQKYPRKYKEELYTFHTSGTRIWYEKGWESYYPDWYKINIGSNYVHNFSMTGHPIEERPRGSVYSFLYHYFHRIRSDMYKFLKEAYNIDFNEKTLLKIKASKGDIEFDTEWVTYKKIITKDDSIQEVESVLFDSPITVLGVAKSKYELLWEAQQENMYYLIRNIQSWEEFLIDFTEDRKKFNRTYGRFWLMFLWSEMDILDFFMGMNKAVEQWVLKELDLKYLNGYYPNFYLIWDNIIDWDFNVIKWEDSDLLVKTQEIVTNWDKTYIDLDEYWRKFREILSDRVSVLSLLWYITLLLWDKFWVPQLRKYKQQVMIPWLFLSWKTKSWKTHTITTLKESSNLLYESRKLTVKSTTPQPLKQAATDDFLLHLEEYTWQIGEVKESILRDILNKGKTSRGMITWDNVEYVYRAWLLIDWEVLPDSESVINRNIVIPMFMQDKKGTSEKLAWFKNISFFKHFIQEIYWHKHDILKLYKQAEVQLLKIWVTDRANSLYSYLLTVNSMFNIFDTDLVKDCVSENLKMFSAIDAWQDPLWDLLSELILTHRVSPVLAPLHDVDWQQVILPFTQNLLNKYKIIVMGAIKEYQWMIKMVWNNMIITHKTADQSDTSERLLKLITVYNQYYKTENLYNYN